MSAVKEEDLMKDREGTAREEGCKWRDWMEGVREERVERREWRVRGRRGSIEVKGDRVAWTV